MIKSLKDARITDGLPRIVAQQPWVQALSGALGVLHEKTMGYADSSQIYTALDTAPEAVLDTLAVGWNIGWYDTGYSVEKKRQIVKTALVIRRTMGTAGAVKTQVDAMYPGTKVEEWFEYGGKPGYFRVRTGSLMALQDGMEPLLSALETTKRLSAHLEKVAAEPVVKQTAGVGIVCQTHMTMTYVMEGMASEAAVTDENGDVLTDENGKVLTV